MLFDKMYRVTYRGYCREIYGWYSALAHREELRKQGKPAKIDFA